MHTLSKMGTYICIRTHIYVRVTFPLYFAKRLISKVQKFRASMKYVLTYLILLQINFVDYVLNYWRLVLRSCYRKLIFRVSSNSPTWFGNTHEPYVCTLLLYILYIVILNFFFEFMFIIIFVLQYLLFISINVYKFASSKYDWKTTNKWEM